MTGGRSRGRWLRRHRERAVYVLTSVALVATVGASVVGGFRLHHAVLIERQTLRTERLAQTALELQDAVSESAPPRRRAASLAAVRAAYADVAAHGRAEAARLAPSYRAFVVASTTGVAADTLRHRRAALESRLSAEIASQAGATRRVNPSARSALIAATVFAAALVALLIWQFELQRRAGRIDRDHAARSEELARMREEFVAVVSHELRTPLTSIVGYLELLSDETSGSLTDEQRTYLAVVLRSSHRLSELVGDLLLVAEGERTPLVLDLATVELGKLADEAVESARPAAAAREISVTAEHDGPVEVAGDAKRLGQLVDNLVSNALKFTPKRGRVTVRVARSGDGAVIEVADNGTGIALADRERVFEPFYRTRLAVEQALPGTGLGLAIVRAIVDAHHGSIEVGAGDGGRGTAFRVQLPLRQSPRAPTATP